MRRLILPFLALACAAIAPAQNLSDYLKLRKANGVKQPVSLSALDSIVGSQVVEIAGTIKGTFSVGEKGALMFDRGDGTTDIVDCEKIPDWLDGSMAKVRLLLKATRVDDASELQLTLIGAAFDSQVQEYDKAPTPVAAKKIVRRNSRPLTSRRGSRNLRRNGPLPQSQQTPVYAQHILRCNPRLTEEEATEIAQYLIGYSLQYGVDARLIVAMVMSESSFDPYATSRTGAQGLGQLMPGTAGELGVDDSYDIEQNLAGMVRLMRGHLDNYKAQGKSNDEALKLAIAAYNAGAGAVKKYGGIPPYRETQNYVRKVLSIYAALTASD